MRVEVFQGCCPLGSGCWSCGRGLGATTCTLASCINRHRTPRWPPKLHAVLFPMMSANQGGPMLPHVVGAWATALLGGGLGIMGGGAAKAAAGRV